MKHFIVAATTTIALLGTACSPPIGVGSARAPVTSNPLHDRLHDAFETGGIAKLLKAAHDNVVFARFEGAGRRSSLFLGGKAHGEWGDAGNCRSPNPGIMFCMQDPVRLAVKTTGLPTGFLDDSSEEADRERLLDRLDGACQLLGYERAAQANVWEGGGAVKLRGDYWEPNGKHVAGRVAKLAKKWDFTFQKAPEASKMAAELFQYVSLEDPFELQVAAEDCSRAGNGRTTCTGKEVQPAKVFAGQASEYVFINSLTCTNLDKASAALLDDAEVHTARQRILTELSAARERFRAVPSSKDYQRQLTEQLLRALVMRGNSRSVSDIESIILREDVGTLAGTERDLSRYLACIAPDLVEPKSPFRPAVVAVLATWGTTLFEGKPKQGSDAPPTGKWLSDAEYARDAFSNCASIVEGAYRGTDPSSDAALPGNIRVPAAESFAGLVRAARYEVIRGTSGTLPIEREKQYRGYLAQANDDDARAILKALDRSDSACKREVRQLAARGGQSFFDGKKLFAECFGGAAGRDSEELSAMLGLTKAAESAVKDRFDKERAEAERLRAEQAPCVSTCSSSQSRCSIICRTLEQQALSNGEMWTGDCYYQCKDEFNECEARCRR